jgi:hypothetical protein
VIREMAPERQASDCSIPPQAFVAFGSLCFGRIKSKGRPGGRLNNCFCETISAKLFLRLETLPRPPQSGSGPSALQGRSSILSTPIPARDLLVL